MKNLVLILISLLSSLSTVNAATEGDTPKCETAKVYVDCRELTDCFWDFDDKKCVPTPSCEKLEYMIDCEGSSGCIWDFDKKQCSEKPES